MNWASTMASNADDAANNRIPGDDSAQDEVGSGSWDPRQVWLTRVKQPVARLAIGSAPAGWKSNSDAALNAVVAT